MGEGASGKEPLGPQSLTEAGFSVDVFMCKGCNKVMDWCDSKFFFVCNISNSWFLGIYQQNNLVARNCLPHICLGKETSAELHKGARRSLFCAPAALSSLSLYKAHQESTFFPHFHGRRKVG